MNQFVAVGIALIVLVGLAWMLYRPRVQQSEKYQAMVVPLANIIDIGFIVMSPAIVLLAGFAAVLFDASSNRGSQVLHQYVQVVRVLLE